MPLTSYYQNANLDSIKVYRNLITKKTFSWSFSNIFFFQTWESYFVFVYYLNTRLHEFCFFWKIDNTLYENIKHTRRHVIFTKKKYWTMDLFNNIAFHMGMVFFAGYAQINSQKKTEKHNFLNGIMVKIYFIQYCIITICI